MKIVYATASPVPSLAANSIHVMKMAQALARNGHDVVLIARNKMKDEVEAGPGGVFGFYGVAPLFAFRSFRCLPGKAGVILHAFRVALAASLAGADILYTRCLPTACAAALTGLRVIYERHDDFGSAGKGSRKAFSWLAARRNLLGVVVISEALAQHISEEHGVPRAKIIVAHDGAVARNDHRRLESEELFESGAELERVRR